MLGVGQTPFSSLQRESTTEDLVFAAVSAALDDAALDHRAIDAAMFASGPDAFDGVHEPDLAVASAFVGGRGLPAFRVQTGGSTGASAAIAGMMLVFSGRFERVLVVGVQRGAQSANPDAVFKTMFDPVYEADMQLTGISTAALQATRQMEYFGLTEDHLDWIAAKNRRCAMRNPMAHLRRPATPADIRSSRMLAWPLRLGHCCPRSEGACAIILGSAHAARTSNHPAWISGIGCSTDVYRIGDRISDMGWDFAQQRSLAWATATAYDRAGISNPRGQLDVAELFTPFANLEVSSYEAIGLTPPGMGWQLVEEGVTDFDGSLPVCPSGGCLTTNPVGPAGLIRIAEAALQVTGRAGEHQVHGAKTALATATSGVNQGAVAVVVTAAPNTEV